MNTVKRQEEFKKVLVDRFGGSTVKVTGVPYTVVNVISDNLSLVFYIPYINYVLITIYSYPIGTFPAGIFKERVHSVSFLNSKMEKELKRLLIDNADIIVLPDWLF